MDTNRKIRKGQEKMLKIPEFAGRLGLSDGAVKKMVYRRQITIVKIGRSVRIPESELDRLIKAGTRPSIQEAR